MSIVSVCALHTSFSFIKLFCAAFKGDWCSVGDVAMLDADGFVFILDRKIDMIISGGVNIYPAEVEAALHLHPAVADVAVFGVPDDDYGERVHAAVQLKPGFTGGAGPTDSVSERELIAFCQERIARFKAPKQVTFHDELPRTDHGKIMKRVIRDKYWEGRKAKL